MRKFLILPIFLSFLSTKMEATGDSLNYLTLKDTIFLSIGFGQEKMFTHVLEKKQTLFSLSKFYGLTIEELYFYNPGLNEHSTKVGQGIRVPIPNRAIIRYKNVDFFDDLHVPVYYVVKKGDTLYRIAKYIFRMPIEELMFRNGLPSFDLSTGQKLHVGWMSLAGIPEIPRENHEGPYARKNSTLKKAYQKSLINKKVKQEQGVASWKTDSEENSDLYALHSSAALNSVIMITNPMNNRTIYAKVIGRIPLTAYDQNVVVVLSPLAAKILGAIDPRFFVKVNYQY